jgi:hypothetical protein
MADPTAALLWAACRLQPSAAEVADAVHAGADLSLAADLAIAQRISPLLWRALREAGAVTGGEPWAHELEQDTKRCHAQSRLLLPLVGRLALQPLVDRDLEPLVIKGAALAHRYPDAALRPMDDVDMILPPESAPAAAAALEAAGWKRLPTPTRRRFQDDYVHPSSPGLHIDLHYQLANWRTRANRLGTTALWEARQPSTLFGAPAFVLPPEHEIVLLASHAAKPYHGFDRLIWTVDIAVVITDAETDGGVNWGRVAELASKASCRTAVAVALTLAGRLGVRSPPELRDIDPQRAKVLAPLLDHTWPIAPRSPAFRNVLRYALVDERRLRLTLAADEVSRHGWWNVPRAAATLARRATTRYFDRRRASLS